MINSLEFGAKIMQQSNQSVFFPWRLPTLILGLIVATIYSNVVGLSVSFSFWYLFPFGQFLHHLGIEDYTINFCVQILSKLAILLSIAFFLKQRLESKSISIRNFLGVNRLTRKDVVLPITIGVCLMGLRPLINKYVTGEYDTPPQGELQIPWFIALFISILVYAVLVGLVEEMYFRGLLYPALKNKFSFHIALIGTSLIFTLAHYSYFSSFVGTLFIFLFGLISSLIFEHRKILLSCVFFHIAANSTLWIIYYCLFFI